MNASEWRKKGTKRYSEAFKMQVVREYEAGEHGSVAEAARKYGITGRETVKGWLVKHGKEHLMKKVIRVEAVGEADRLKALEKELRQLKEALADAHVDLKLGEAYLKIACRRAGEEDVAAFKKVRWGAVREAVEGGGCGVRRACGRAGMSRQNYYACRKLRRKRDVDEKVVLEEVRRERSRQPRIGVRKLKHLVGGRLGKVGVEVGRDRLFGILREAGLLVGRKARTKRTTQSRHSLPVFRNRLRGLELSGPNEAWVSDLTYVRTEEGFVYAAVIMDAWSRKLVGMHVGDSLESEGCQKALQEALKGLPEGKHPIHHSDRGCQYCCHEYVSMLREAGMPVSMTEERHCYENAKAERVIGILKGEYELDQTFRTKELARTAAMEARSLYNESRPHMALDYRMPAEAHGCN